MKNFDSLLTRACCAPLPREINNYYNRSHGKKKNHADCKGACYCNSPNCNCVHKGLEESHSNTNVCNCCKNYSENPTVKTISSKPKKGACLKCKRPKRQRSSSPNFSKNNSIFCRCCSPNRCSSPQRESTACKCTKNASNNCKRPANVKSKDKKYTIMCYKPYENGDSMLDEGYEYNEKCHCSKGNRQSLWRKREHMEGADGQQNRNICTCCLKTPGDCKVEGLWCTCGDKDEAAPPCRRCGQKVYAAEKVVASGGAFHTSCFSCYGCHKALEVTNLYESQGEIYCKQCYSKYFGMSGYGYGATLLSPM